MFDHTIFSGVFFRILSTFKVLTTTIRSRLHVCVSQCRRASHLTSAYIHIGFVYTERVHCERSFSVTEIKVS